MSRQPIALFRLVLMRQAMEILYSLPTGFISKISHSTAKILGLVSAAGALGFWKGLEEPLPGARAQQCWVHKTANVLDKMSQRLRPDAKRLLHEMYLSLI